MIILPNSFEYNLFLNLTLILLSVKIILTIYLLIEILRRRKKEGGKLQVDFVFAIFVFMICLIISRVVYMIFDFKLTYFNAETYFKFPNYVFWKIGLFIGVIGFAFVIFIIDKKALKFKLKGILSYFPIAIGLIILFWPVNSSQDIIFMSFLGIISTVSGLLLISLFIYLGITIQPLRKISFLITFGFLLYAFGSVLVSEFVLEPARVIYGPQIHIIAYLAYLIFKIIGLVLISYCIKKFIV